MLQNRPKQNRTRGWGLVLSFLAGGVGVAAGAKELELEVRGPSPFEAVDAEVGHHGLAVAVADGGDDLLVLGAGELVEKDAVGRLVDAEAPDVADDVGDGMLDLVVGAAEGVVEVAAGGARPCTPEGAPRRARGPSRDCQHGAAVARGPF